MILREVTDAKRIQFAIRPSIRNNTELTREEVIKTVAAMVGPGHKVDLGGYDLLILVEIYKVSPHMCDYASLQPHAPSAGER
jgi:hypothetical protein